MKFVGNFMRSCLVIIFFLSGFFFLPAAAQEKNASTFFIEGSNKEWYVDEQERTRDVRIAEFLGRQALWLKNGSQVMRPGIEFTDGTIEFDLAPMDKGNFLGVLFRRNSFSDHENIYLRLHRSGQFNAVQ